MAKGEYSSYQKDVISRYYDNRHIILLQRLQELVTELYLADTEPKKKKLWQRVHKSMVDLKIQPAIVEHIMSKASVEILAKNVAEWVSQKPQK